MIETVLGQDVMHSRMWQNCRQSTATACGHLLLLAQAHKLQHEHVLVALERLHLVHDSAKGAHLQHSQPKHINTKIR